MRATADTPKRSTATVTISWGIITIPLSLYSSTEETRVARQERSIHTGNPVGRQAYDKVTGAVLGNTDVKRVALSDKGVEVELTDDEVTSVTGSPTGVAEIIGLVDAADIGSEYMPIKLYQARPKSERGKSSAAADKAFALLLAALEDRGQVAIVKLAVRGGIAHYAAVTPDGYLVQLAYIDAVRQALPLPKVELSDREMTLAGQLLDAIGPMTTEMRDDSSAKVADYVNAKAKAGGERPRVEAPTAATGVDDLLASLEASLGTKAAS